MLYGSETWCLFHFYTQVVEEWLPSDKGSHILRSLPCFALRISTTHNTPLSSTFFVLQLFQMAQARGKFRKFVRKRELQRREKLAAL